MVELSVEKPQVHVLTTKEAVLEEIPIMDKRNRFSLRHRHVVFSSMRSILDDGNCWVTSRKDDDPAIVDVEECYSTALSKMNSGQASCVDISGSHEQAAEVVLPVKGDSQHSTRSKTTAIKRLSATDESYKKNSTTKKSPFSKSKSLDSITSTSTNSQRKSIRNGSIRPSRTTKNESWGVSKGYWEDAAKSLERGSASSKNRIKSLKKRTNSRRRSTSLSSSSVKGIQKSQSLDNCLIASTQGTRLFQSELEDRKSTMSSVHNSIGFQPVEIHPIQDEEKVTTMTPITLPRTTKEEEEEKEEEHVVNNEVDLLSSEILEMNHIMTSLRQMIGFQPVEITSMMDSFSSDNDKSSPTPKDEEDTVELLSAFIKDKREENKGREEEDGDEDSDSTRNHPELKTINRALGICEKDEEKNVKDEKKTKEEEEESHRSLLPGRPETIMASDLRDFLRQQIEDEEDNNDGKTPLTNSNQNTGHVVLDPACLEYLNRRKAVEEHSKLIEWEKPQVQQRLADRKAKRLERFRANKKTAATAATTPIRTTAR